jgi:ABC-type branched-subunit amino acid transport system substrate-binding protein
VGTYLPDALVLPLPPEDIEILAPQLTFYGIDTLGVQILGTDGWTSDMVRTEVISRHTDGVVATAPRAPGVELPAYLLFLERYEALHRKTLRSRIPSLGYDAAALVLEAAGRGGRNPDDLRQALENIREYPGATGSLSVEDGRIVRVQHLVRFRGRELLQIPRDFYQQR